MNLNYMGQISRIIIFTCKKRANLGNYHRKFVKFARKSLKFLSNIRKNGLNFKYFMQLRGIDKIWYAIKRDF